MNKVKSRFIPGVIAVAAAATIAIYLLPNVRASRVDDREEVAVVTITFSPEKRSGEAQGGRQLKDVVIVEIEMKPELQLKEPVTKSGWSTTLYPRRGQRIWVKATQVYGTNIVCTIVVNGEQVSHDKNTGPRSVSCTYTRAR